MSEIFRIEQGGFLDIIEYPDITIKDKQTTFVTGPSGCGKSTLLKIFNGTVSLSSGKAYYKNIDIDTIDTISLRREAILISQSVFLFDKTIEKNFEEFAESRGQEPLNNMEKEKYLELAMADFPLNMDCTSMSGGERQRVYIAICMSFFPEILMLDEPTSALDYDTASKLLEKVEIFCKNNGKTLIVISHDKSLADKFADEIIKLAGKDIDNE